LASMALGWCSDFGGRAGTAIRHHWIGDGTTGCVFAVNRSETSFFSLVVIQKYPKISSTANREIIF